MKFGSRLILAGLLVALLAGCDFLGSAPKGSPTPFPTLLPLLTPSPTIGPAASGPASAVPASPTASPQATATSALLVLPEEFTLIPSGRGTYKYEAKSKGGILQQGTPKNMRLGHCGLASPVDVDGSLWDPAYGNDGSGGPLTDDQKNELHNEGRVTITLLSDGTLQMVTRGGAFITFTRHEGPRRYSVCA